MTSLHIISNETTVAQLKCSTAFESLTDKEKLYAHYIAQASFEGSKIVLMTTSPESPAIFCLLMRIFGEQPATEVTNEAKKAGIDDSFITQFMVYCATFFSNMGNYKSFGDTKFIPDISVDAFFSIVKLTKAYEKNAEEIEKLWTTCSKRLFSLNQRDKLLGLGKDSGVSTYYSHDFDKDKADMIQRYLDSNSISAYNTRVFLTSEGVYQIRFASAEEKKTEKIPEMIEFEGKQIQLMYGDFSPLMQRVVDNLTKALDHVANPAQKDMILKYVDSFSGGSIEDHIEGSTHWIKDKGPVVESYIGFIESYRDPYGTRGEFEGFVAVVNKKMSAKFSTLVDNAESLLSLLPWPKEFEKDVFLRPDFTSLEVVAFGGSGIPAGINIPNYDSIRQDIGFKNVSLGNVLAARSFKSRVTFLCDDDQEDFKHLLGESFEVQVAGHELLGHGSGKLFYEDKVAADGIKIINPLSGKEIECMYKAGETWDSKFSVIASSYEECRAELVGIYMSTFDEMLNIFGYTDPVVAEKITYINWLNMARAGLCGLEFFSPEKTKWGQAHMQARYAILRVFLEAGEDFVTISVSDDNGDVVVKLDRTKIKTVGMKAVSDFLLKIQVFKSTADTDGAFALYDKYTSVDDKFLNLRDIVLKNKKPRQMFVQAVTTVSEDGSQVTLTEYEASPEGLCDSFAARFPAIDLPLMELYTAEADMHKYE